MLLDGHVYAKLPASDFDRARRFYLETLGLRPNAEGAGFLLFRCAGESSFVVFASSGRSSGDHDQCGWVVDDLDAEIADLRRRGIAFQEFPGYEFVDGVKVAPAGRSVWFRDSEGNLLNVRGDAPGSGAARRS